MTSIKPSMRQRVWDYCSEPRTSAQIKAHTQAARYMDPIKSMLRVGMLQSVSRGVYVRTDIAPKGQGHWKGKAQPKANRKAPAPKPLKTAVQVSSSVAPRYTWQTTPATVTMRNGVRVVVLPPPPDRFSVTSAPRTFEFEFERQARAVQS
jgi:hypothetical protein